ncbi:hypothetical protein ACFPRL_33140 [Pseudoclavibacter helvolus]
MRNRPQNTDRRAHAGFLSTFPPVTPGEAPRPATTPECRRSVRLSAQRSDFIRPAQQLHEPSAVTL